MTTQQIIGENLTELREQQGLTRGDIAKGVSVTNQTVAAWEWGTRCPSVDLLMKICELLSVTPNDLVYNDLVYEESSRVSSREKKEPVLRVQKDNFHRTAVGKCPSCNTEVHYKENTKKYNRYCHCCGQALRW